ncbi:hypothetical protein KKA49_01540 [Patescibacteria group bacterium]|nr:hypothetical protein [Patescibacteria group bacterium]MBU1457596.1 hypothetical protein [Patescibacteria group bacterium]
MKKEEENGRQLKLGERDGEEDRGEKKKNKKKRNKPRERRVIFVVLFITILVSLGFYIVSGGVKLEKKEKVENGSRVKPGMTDGDGFFGSAVYEF